MAPDAADPDEIFPIVFPTPIARDSSRRHPLAVSPRGAVLRRDSVDAWNHKPRRGAVADRHGIRFVDRSPGQHLHTTLHAGLCRRCSAGMGGGGNGSWAATGGTCVGQAASASKPTPAATPAKSGRFRSPLMGKGLQSRLGYINLPCGGRGRHFIDKLAVSAREINGCTRRCASVLMVGEGLAAVQRGLPHSPSAVAADCARTCVKSRSYSWPAVEGQPRGIGRHSATMRQSADEPLTPHERGPRAVP